MRIDHRAGFTLLELLVFAAIFSLVSIGLLAILTSYTTLTVRQDAQAEVNQQSLAILQSLQAYVEDASLIDMDTTATSTLKLRMASSSADPTYILLSGDTLYVRQTESGALQPLNSSRVLVSEATFTKRENAAGRDSVRMSFTLVYNTDSIVKRFIQGFTTSVARVNAATFDANLVPGTTATYKLGVSTSTWQSINDILYFSSSNVGVGVASPGQTLEVNGGVRLNTATSKPTCDSSQRGTFWVTQSGGGVKDAVEVCVRNASSSYLWSPIY